MSFRDFTANILSTRDYKGSSIEKSDLADITAYLENINSGVGTEKGFAFIMLENGGEVYKDLEGVGGYSGIMIRSPHYIGLVISKENPEIEFYGAYYMQAIVKRLYSMKLGSCWINIRDIAQDKKSKLLKNNTGTINYLLAFGVADDKAIKNKTPQMTVTSDNSSYTQNPYGTKVNEAVSSDKSRYSVEEIVYMYEWGRQATYEELESRGMEEIFFYVRNAPSYKNLQSCRLILMDGKAELAVMNPINEGSYVDAGIMMYTLEGLAKDLGVPGEWHFVKDESTDKKYSVVAKIEL